MDQPLQNRISRRRFLQAASAVSSVAAVSPSLLFAAPAKSGRLLFCANAKGKQGLYGAAWNAATGEVSAPELLVPLEEASFAALGAGPTRNCVYVVSEVAGPASRVTGFAIERGGTALRMINSQPANGEGTTHLSVAPNGGALAVANYNSGSVTSYRILPDGTISPAVSHFQYSGHGPNAERQAGPHAHSARYSPDGRFVLVNDLGLDRIFVYRADARTGALTPNDPPFWQGTPGSGPRHIAFHPNGRYVYSVNELHSTVEILQWDGQRGVLKSLGAVSSLPEGFAKNTAFAGEIAISNDARFLYVGNRVGADTIATFSVGDGGRTLKLEQLVPNGGKNTRFLTIDPSGRWVVLCNVTSGSVVTLKRDAANGKLSEAVHTVPLPGAMCCVFLPA